MDNLCGIREKFAENYVLYCVKVTTINHAKSAKANNLNINSKQFTLSCDGISAKVN